MIAKSGLFVLASALLAGALLAMPSASFAASCLPVVDGTIQWQAANLRNYTAVRLFGSRESTGTFFRVTTGPLVYTPERYQGSPPMMIRIPAELSTGVSAEMVSSNEPPQQVHLKIVLSDNPRVIVKRASDGRLIDSYTSRGECQSSDKIGGSSRNGAAYQTQLFFEQRPH